MDRWMDGQMDRWIDWFQAEAHGQMHIIKPRIQSPHVTKHFLFRANVLYDFYDTTHCVRCLRIFNLTLVLSRRSNRWTGPTRAAGKQRIAWWHGSSWRRWSNWSAWTIWKWRPARTARTSRIRWATRAARYSDEDIKWCYGVKWLIWYMLRYSGI